MPQKITKKKLVLIDRWTKVYGDLYCFYCSKVLQKSEVTVDHFVPKARGGTDAWGNLLVSCKACNEFKGSETMRSSLDPRHEKVMLLLAA